MRKMSQNKRLSRYVTRRDTHIMTLNGVTIDDYIPSESLALAVFKNFSGESHTNHREPDYKGGSLNREEFVRIHEKRLGVKLKGHLQIINTWTNEVIISCSILGGDYV